jgi:tol-pal system protein YbgF
MKEGFALTTNRRGHWLAPIACMGLLTALLSGCVATKSDVRLLREDVARLQATQDSLYRESVRRSGSLADSVRQTTELLRTTRGALSAQIKQLQDMLITLSELAGQTQQRITQMREQAERALQQQQQQQAAAQAPAVADPAQADALYRAGTTKLQEKSATAARVAFEEFLEKYPQHERAADAQFGLAESYVLNEDLAEAVTSFERVSEAYPTSTRAPEALYRAGEISEQRKRPDDARRYYNLVVQRYASSPAARLAQAKLTKLRKN